jgi:hypothetical protein
MENKTKKRGGARKGAGRKGFLSDSKRVNIKIPLEIKEQVKEFAWKIDKEIYKEKIKQNIQFLKNQV